MACTLCPELLLEVVRSQYLSHRNHTHSDTQTNKKKTKCLHKKSQSTQSLLSLTQSITLSPFQILQPFWQFSAKAFHIVFSIDFPAHFLNTSFELLWGFLPRTLWGLVLHPLTNQITIIIAYIFFVSLFLYFLTLKKK